MDIPEPADLDWYRLLGIKQEATGDEIKRAFRKLALVHHPDKAGGVPDAGSRFRRIREAHDTLCDAHRRYCFDLRYERISAEWDKYEAAQEDNRVKREAERVRKEKLEKKATRERAARERMERERSHLEKVEKLRADVQNMERSCKRERECADRESRANIPISPDNMDETGKPHGFAWRHDTILLKFMEQYLERVRADIQNHEKLCEEMRNRHEQASEEEARAEAADEEAEERQARERKAQEDAARKKEAEEKAAKAEAERERAKEKAKMEREAREKAMRERERLAEQRSQEAAKRAREAQEEAARERLAHQARADKEAREAKAAEEEARRRMTPELEEMFKLFQEFRIRSEKESRKAGTRKGARGSDCTHRMWWPRSYGTDDFMAMSTKQYTPKLPLEIWTKILENLGKDKQTIMTLWTVCRQVCTAFRDAVDLIFVAKHLPKTWLMFDFDLLWDEDQGNVDLSTEFSLKDLSDDRKLAIFQGEGQDGNVRKTQGQMISDALDAATVEKPVPYVQFRRQVHDTEVPGMEFDPESFELRFDWRGLFSSFFAEEKRYEMLMRGWIESKKSWIEDMRAKVERGEVDMADSMEQAMKLFTHETENVRRDARRARIRRQYLEKHDWHWKVDEIDKRAEWWILETLKSKHFAASMEEYSDDEEDVEDCEMDDDLVDEDVGDDIDESGDEDEDEDENEDENENENEDAD